MRRRLFSASILLAAAAGLASQVVPAAARPGDPQGPVIAGAYYIDFTEGPLSFHGLTVAHPDGTLTVSDTNDFGYGGGGLNCPQYGTWVATGANSVRQKTLFFGYDGQGNHIYTVRSEFQTTTVDRFQTGAFTFTAKVFLPQQDPLDPNSVPVQIFDGTGSMRKINP